jgi:hypothetical protein
MNCRVLSLIAALLIIAVMSDPCSASTGYRPKPVAARPHRVAQAHVPHAELAPAPTFPGFPSGSGTLTSVVVPAASTSVETYSAISVAPLYAYISVVRLETGTLKPSVVVRVFPQQLPLQV